jgi:hypothetical protein
MSPSSETAPCLRNSEIDAEPHARLKAAELSPLDPKVKSINAIVSVYDAEKTSKGVTTSAGGS